MEKMKITSKPLKDLIPAAYNPRKITEPALNGLAKSLERFGCVEPIVWNKRSGNVVGGHQRLAVLKRQKNKNADVVVVDLNETEEKALNIALNNQAIQGEWDLEKLPEILDELKLDFEDFGELRFDELKIDLGLHDGGVTGEVIEDEPPEPPENPVSQIGDLWLMGEHRLLCGDSADQKEIARLMNSEKAKLLNTDPPYGVDYSKTKTGIPRSGFKDHNEKWGDIASDDLQDAKLQEFLESVFVTVLPHLDNAAWYLWHAHLTQGFFAAAAAAAAADVLLHRQIIWKKPGFVLTRSGQYHWAHEPCFYGWVRGKQPAWHGNLSQTSVWELKHDSNGRVHPTQKPVGLFAIPIRNHLREGEVCLEPFAGSGSQIIAAEQLKVKCYAAEIEPKFSDAIIQRWQNFTGGKAVLAGREKTYEQTKKVRS